MNFLESCKKIINIESTPSTGNEEVALFCAQLCRDAGMHVTLQEAELNSKKQINVLARPAALTVKKEEIIFQSHLDTVEPGPLSNWTKTDNNPFKATIEEDRIYGLGTTDVKLDFLCKLHALKNFVSKPMQRPFVLVGTFGEEIGMHGAHHLIKSHAVHAKMAIIGEPSELQVVHANNGYMILEFFIPFNESEVEYFKKQAPASTTTQEKIFRGKAAHSSTPQLGESAILKLIQYLEKLPQGTALIEAVGGASVNTVPAEAHLEVDGGHFFTSSVGDRLLNLARTLKKLEREFLNFEAKEFSPPHPTLNLGILKTTPKGLELSVSFRVTPNVEMAEIEEWVENIQKSGEPDKTVCVRSRLSPPALTSLESPLVTGASEILKNLKLRHTPITKASGTECSVYRPQGMDCIVFGPGVSIGNSHTANEFNILSQLESAQAFYAEAVKRFCL